MGLTRGLQAGPKGVKMGRIFRRSVFIPILCIFTVWFFSGGVSSAAGQKITKENGIEVIHNPKDPVQLKGVPSTPVLKEDLVIGAESGDERFIFSEIRAIRADDEGNIYALDWKAHQIKVFDRTGRLLRTFGKKGQGPGEWQAPHVMVIAPSGQIVVRDMANWRFSFYSPEGKLLKEIPSQGFGFQKARIDKKGFFYGNSLEFGEKDTAERLMRYGPDLKPAATIAEFKENPQPDTDDLFAENTCFDVVKGDNLAWARTGKYEIKVVDQAGQTVKRIIKDFEPRRITEKDKKDRIQNYYGGHDHSGRKIVFPEYFPPIRAFIADDEGRLYVRTFEKDESGKDLYDIFDPDGRCIARFALPASEWIEAVRKGKVYCTSEADESGTQQIKRYSLEWK